MKILIIISNKVDPSSVSLNYAVSMIESGHTTEIYCFADFIGKNEEIFRKISAGYYSFIFTGFVTLKDINVGGVNFFEWCPIPIILQLYDNIYITDDALFIRRLPKTVFLYGDYDSMLNQRRFYPHTNCAYLPHIGYVNVEDGEYVPYDKKDIDVSAVWTVRNVIDKDDINKHYGKLVAEIFEQCTTMLLKSSSLSHFEVLDSVLASYGMYFSDSSIIEKRKFLWQIDKYVREVRRDDAVKSLLNAGITLTHFGKIMGNRDYFNHKNYKYCGELPQEEYTKTLKRSKLHISSNGASVSSMHERVPTSMINKTLSVSDSSKYMIENFIDGENILLYDYQNVELLGEKCADILSKPSKLMEIIENAKVLADNHYSAQSRLPELLRIVEFINT